MEAAGGHARADPQERQADPELHRRDPARQDARRDARPAPLACAGAEKMKKLLNEVLPDPKQAERDLGAGSPRDRTAAHLKRIVAAAAALHLGAAVADNSVPGDKGKDGKNQKPPEAQKPPEKPPEQPGYLVVDPVPPPYINRNEGEGWLRI